MYFANKNAQVPKIGIEVYLILFLKKIPRLKKDTTSCGLECVK